MNQNLNIIFLANARTGEHRRTTALLGQEKCEAELEDFPERLSSPRQRIPCFIPTLDGMP